MPPVNWTKVVTSTALLAICCALFFALAIQALVKLEMQTATANPNYVSVPPFQDMSPRLGERFHDFSLPDTNGHAAAFGEIASGRPVILQFGSFT